MNETIKWIKVKIRKLTEEEIKYWEEREVGIPFEYMMDCDMPEDGEEILIQSIYGVNTDINCIDEGYYLEGIGDWEDVIAWAKMPKGIGVINNE